MQSTSRCMMSMKPDAKPIKKYREEPILIQDHQIRQRKWVSILRSRYPAQLTDSLLLKSPTVE